METTSPSTSYSHTGGTPQVMNVIVRDIEMSFGSMVVFILKWVLASIPAMLIMFIFFAVLGGLFGGIFSMFT